MAKGFRKTDKLPRSNSKKRRDELRDEIRIERREYPGWHTETQTILGGIRRSKVVDGRRRTKGPFQFAEAGRCDSCGSTSIHWSNEYAVQCQECGWRASVHHFADDDEEPRVVDGVPIIPAPVVYMEYDPKTGSTRTWTDAALEMGKLMAECQA